MDFPKDIILTIVFVIISVIFIVVSPLNATPLRIFFGFFFILFLPGYSLVSALFPNGSDLDVIERTILSVGLSICVVVFVGLALNFTPFGIRLGPVVLVLSVFTLTLTGVNAFRKIGIGSIN